MLKKALRPWEGLDDAELERLEALIHDDYATSRPGDTLEDLNRRARFSKADAGLLRDWLEVARCRAAPALSDSHMAAA
jgi:hypothetical protein